MATGLSRLAACCPPWSANWIRAANSSKTHTGTSPVTFTLGAAAGVHVGMDTRAPLPSWLDATWTDIGESITTSESGTTRTFHL
jgi:hypothetical protein